MRVARIHEGLDVISAMFCTDDKLDSDVQDDLTRIRMFVDQLWAEAVS